MHLDNFLGSYITNRLLRKQGMTFRGERRWCTVEVESTIPKKGEWGKKAGRILLLLSSLLAALARLVEAVKSLIW